MKQCSLEQYEQLRAEMNSRIELTFSFSHNTISVVLALWTLSIGMYTHLSENDTRAWLFALIQSFVFVITLLLLVPLSAKYSDNLRQISSLGSYLKAFYELPSLLNDDETVFSWEIENGKMSSIILDKGKKSFLSKLFTLDFLLLGILSSALYVVFAIIANFQLIKINASVIYFSVILGMESVLFLLSAFALILIYNGTQIKTNFMEYIKQSANLYLNDALKLGFYDGFPFDEYCNKGAELTNKQKIKILLEYIS